MRVWLIVLDSLHITYVLEEYSGDADFCHGIFLDVVTIPHKHTHEALERLTKIFTGGEGFFLSDLEK